MSSNSTEIFDALESSLNLKTTKLEKKLRVIRTMLTTNKNNLTSVRRLAIELEKAENIVGHYDVQNIGKILELRKEAFVYTVDTYYSKSIEAIGMEDYGTASRMITLAEDFITSKGKLVPDRITYLKNKLSTYSS